MTTNKPHSLMSDPISTMYFHNMSFDLLNKILFEPNCDILDNNSQLKCVIADVTGK